MTTRHRPAVVVLATLALAGCAAESGPKQTGGALLGATGGGLLGAALSRDRGSSTRAFGTALGAVGGLLAGGSAGRSLDRADAVWARQGPAYYQPRHQTPSLYRGAPAAYAPPPQYGYQPAWGPPAAYHYPQPRAYYPSYGYPPY